MACPVSHLDPIGEIPDAPDLTAAGIKRGDTFVEPTFGTTLMRVTDESDGDHNQVAYSYWPTFNKDSSRLFIHSGKVGPSGESGPALYDFNATDFAISNKRALPSPNGKAIEWQGTIWSGKDPGILYTFEGLNIWRCDVSVNPPMFDAAPLTSIPADLCDLPVATLWQMSMSLDDNTFAFTLRDGAGVKVGYAVWRRDPEGIVLCESTPTPSGPGSLDEVHIDKSGDYLVAFHEGYEGASHPEAIVARVWDLPLLGSPPPAKDLTDGDPDYAPGHYDTGDGTLIGHDRWGKTCTTRRSLSDPHAVEFVLELTGVKQAYHVSMLADDESTALLSFYGTSTASGRFHGEIIQIPLTDSAQPCRLAHHHSVKQDRDYWDEPHANISRDGRFVAFTSNWGSSTREDVFIVRVPEP
jgi:hypothetical protein